MHATKVPGTERQNVEEVNQVSADLRGVQENVRTNAMGPGTSMDERTIATKFLSCFHLAGTKTEKHTFGNYWKKLVIKKYNVYILCI